MRIVSWVNAVANGLIGWRKSQEILCYSLIFLHPYKFKKVDLVIKTQILMKLADRDFFDQLHLLTFTNMLILTVEDKRIYSERGVYVI